MEYRDEEHPGYPVSPPPTGDLVDEDPPSTSTTAKHTSRSSKQKKPSTTTGQKPSASTSLSVSPSQTSTNGFSFVQMQSNASYKLSEGHFLDANFPGICPSQNCLNDCKNLTQVFTATPGALNNSTDMDVEDVQVTLFGVCSNLANATASVDNSDNLALKSYFQTTSADSDDDIGLITSNLTMCLVDTCESTRNPSECNHYCQPDYLLQSQYTLSVYPGVFQCAHQLCQSTCGLPYANQDVFGIGVRCDFSILLLQPNIYSGQVLISYYIQAILLVLLALAFVSSAAVQAWKHQRSPTAPEVGKPALKTFLNAQCYFGASAAVAAFFMDPRNIDPLNGYPLVSVALMGCIGPVFTLSLLSSHGVTSRSSMLLCILSWVLNTIVFFTLVSNLSRSLDDHWIVDQALRSLSETSLCGGSSAMVLCQEWMSMNPLQSLSRFFNKDSIPNISNVPVVWALTAVILLILISSQAYQAFKSSGTSIEKAPKSMRPGFLQRRGIVQALIEGLASPWASFVMLLLTVVFFSLALAYEYVMVRAYSDMDVIDMDGWTFGQVVAVLFWVPPLFDATQSLLASLKKGNLKQDPVRPRHKHQHLDSYENYRPVAYSPAPSPGIGAREQLDNFSTSGQDTQMESWPLQHRRTTLRTEEGRN